MVVLGQGETQPSERDALFESVSENSIFKLQSRRACPELVERGRLKIGRDAILDNLQSSRRDSTLNPGFQRGHDSIQAEPV
jgi:hypothetical protein